MTNDQRPMIDLLSFQRALHGRQLIIGRWSLASGRWSVVGGHPEPERDEASRIQYNGTSLGQLASAAAMEHDGDSPGRDGRCTIPQRILALRQSREMSSRPTVHLLAVLLSLSFAVPAPAWQRKSDPQLVEASCF